MGKQISFYMDKKTEESFLSYIKENGTLLFEGNNNKPIEIESLPVPFSEKGWFKVYLYNNIGDIKLKRLSNGREIIDSIDSNVIEFSRTVIRDDSKEVTKGRLWFETKFYDENGTLVEKDGTVEEWYKLLSKWIKKNIPKSEFSIDGKIYKEYISESIMCCFNQGYKIV